MILVAGIKGFSESWLNIVVLSTLIYDFPEDDEDYHGCVNKAFKIKFKVCHSSAFSDNFAQISLYENYQL